MNFTPDAGKSHWEQYASVAINGGARMRVSRNGQEVKLRMATADFSAAMHFTPAEARALAAELIAAADAGVVKEAA